MSRMLILWIIYFLIAAPLWIFFAGGMNAMSACTAMGYLCGVYSGRILREREYEES